MESRAAWTEGVDEPALVVLGANNLSKMARRADQITEEVTRIKQRVDRMIQTFERSQSIQATRHIPGMEILEDMDELGEILSDPMQKRRYQQKLTVFIVGYQEICGQRKHVLDQLQEFFSFYCKVNKEDGDLNRLEESSVDMDGVVDQVTGALKSAEMAMCRLADIHSEIVNYVNQTLSTCSSRKRKISDDKNRKKLEKAVEQARGNIVTLTNQLLRAQEDLTSKDQQMKEMLRQHEMRLVEIRHFKGQLEDTKINLQTLQEETAKQRSLLEAEMRIQAGRLAELESQVTFKLNQYRHASSQWEIQELISYTCRATQTPDEEEEKSGVQKTEPVPPNDKEIHGKTMNDNGESQISIMKPSTVDSNIIEAERVSVSEMEASLTMSKQNFPNIISSLMSELITSLPLNEESESICTSLPAYQDGNSIMTAQGDSEETNSFTTEELLPNKTNHPDGPATMPYTFSNQVSHLNASFSLPEENTENVISLPEQEKRFATCDTESFIGTQTMTSHLMFDNTANADTTPRIGSNEKNSPLTSLPVPQINACPPESDVENGKIKVPEIDPIPHHSVPLPAPENNTISVASDGNVYFAKSLSILEVDTNNFLSQPLEDLTFHASQPFEEINCMNPALSSCADTKTDSLSITQHGALEEREENILNSQWDLQAEGGQQTLLDVTGLRGDPQTELLETSYRLHRCLQTIRNVLITGGFHSLANKLEYEDQGVYGEVASINMALLENIPAVLHSLIESASKPENKQTQPADARSQDGEDNAEIKSKKEISATLLDPDRNTVTRECTHNSNNGPLPYASSEWPHLTVMFTHQDERHNRRVLQQAARQGRISGHKYKEASEAMTEYRTILMERMQSFVRGYLMKVSWNQAETLLKKQSLRSPQVLPVLTKLRIQKQQALMHWKEERVRSWEKRLHLSASLDLTLQELQQESGIFLIQPVLSWPRRSQLVKNQRQNHSTCKDFSKSTWLPSYQSNNQDSLRCCGKAPRPLSREWSVLQNHEALRPLVITPKVLEMDIHRYLCKECCVMSKHQTSPIGSTQKSGSPLRNYLVVKRTTPLLSFNYEVGITKFND